MENDVWRTFFGGIFAFASFLLTVFFGAALANVIRGVPIGPDHFFFLPLWTNWQVGPHPGILDWYTVIGGLVAEAALATHGALWIWLKTSDDLSERARRAAGYGWVGLCVMTVVSLIATVEVQPLALRNYGAYPVLYLIPLAVVGSLLGIQLFRNAGKALYAFLSSCAYLVFMLVGAAAGLYPVLLPSSLGNQYNLTISDALTGSYAAHVGLIWWGFGMLLAAGYFVTVYWLFRGKAEGHYHI